MATTFETVERGTVSVDGSELGVGISRAEYIDALREELAAMYPNAELEFPRLGGSGIQRCDAPAGTARGADEALAALCERVYERLCAEGE